MTDRVTQALASVVEDYYGKKCSVREYLEKLLLTLWDEKEAFDGKRPFGDSGWECDLYAALIRDGLIDGRLDDDGYVDDVDDDAGDELIAQAIRKMCEGVR